LVVSRANPEKLPVGPEAELLVAFVNTRDVEEGTDTVAEPDGLAAWAAEHAGDVAVGVPGADAHRQVLALRESLRALLRANNGGTADAADLASLREAAARSRYRTTLAPDGRLAIGPEGDGVAALEARLLLAVERLQAQGAWPRLKACPADDCQWAFFDTSRNRSRTWCSMEECGNREKTRRYRGKARAT
jgi:predicted RNA-binding Zn ribbon-like protein